LRRLLGTTPIGLVDAAVVSAAAVAPSLVRELTKRARLGVPKRARKAKP
jgi:hypothetical protein